jgi:hypothetical protein
MNEKFKDKVDFVSVYIREIHAKDGWHMENETIDYNQPKNIEERQACCQKLIDLYQPKMTVVMDDMDNAVDKALCALPERLYIVLDGKVVYKGKRGPFDYHPSEVEDWLKKHDY